MKGGGQTTATGTQNTTSGQNQNLTTQKTPWDQALASLTGSLGGLNSSYQPSLDATLAALQSGQSTASSLYGSTGGLNLTGVGSSLNNIIGGGTNGVSSGSTTDASAALQKMLSGTPDYSGLQASIDAANAPLLRQFNQQIIPGLNQRASFLNNPTGGIKSLNTVLPDLGQRMSENAATLTEAERQRALTAQQNGLSLYGSLSGQANNQAIQAAGLFPQLSSLGLIPSQIGQQIGQLPFTMSQGLSNSVLPYASVGGGTSSTGASTGTGTSSTSSTMNNTGGNTFGQILGNGITLDSLLGGALSKGLGSLVSGAGKSLSSGLGNLFGSSGSFTPGLTSAVDAANAGVGTDVASSLGSLTDSSFASASPGIDAAIQGGLDSAGAGGGGLAAVGGAGALGAGALSGIGAGVGTDLAASLAPSLSGVAASIGAGSGGLGASLGGATAVGVPGGFGAGAGTAASAAAPAAGGSFLSGLGAVAGPAAAMIGVAGLLDKLSGGSDYFGQDPALEGQVASSLGMTVDQFRQKMAQMKASNPTFLQPDQSTVNQQQQDAIDFAKKWSAAGGNIGGTMGSATPQMSTPLTAPQSDGGVAPLWQQLGFPSMDALLKSGLLTAAGG